MCRTWNRKFDYDIRIRTQKHRSRSPALWLWTVARPQLRRSIQLFIAQLLENKKNAILKFWYFIGKNLSFLTRWLKKKKSVQIWEKVKFIFDFRKWRSNFDFFQKWLQPVERSRISVKKNIRSKILHYAKKNKLYSFEKEAAHQKSENCTSLISANICQNENFFL